MGYDNYLVQKGHLYCNSKEGWDFDKNEVNPEKPEEVVHSKAQIPYDLQNLFKPEFVRAKQGSRKQVESKELHQKSEFENTILRHSH